MHPAPWFEGVICLSLRVDGSSWTTDVPGSITGLIGSCVVIPCSFDYPHFVPKKSTELKGIWLDQNREFVYHPDSSKMAKKYQNRVRLLGALTTPEPITLEVDKDLREGESASASCSVPHTCPTAPPNFTWTHFGLQTFLSHPREDGQWHAKSWLSFALTRDLHNKSFGCTVRYKGGKKSDRSEVLLVKHAPMNVTVQPQWRVLEGKALELRCLSDGYPAPHRYRWCGDDGVLLHSGQLYLLPNVSRRTEPLYCSATNTQGHAQSRLVRFNAMYPPGVLQTSGCSASTLRLSCECTVESNPPAVVYLSRPDGLLLSATLETRSSVTVATLVGGGEALGSSDHIYCHAVNILGNATLTLQVPSIMSPLSLPGVMDAEGRVDESRLRMHILKHGGVSPSERGLVWRFLFGMYPCSSTAAERPLLVEQMAVRYQVMKSKWQRSVPAAVRLRLNGTDAELVDAVRYHDRRQAEANKQTQEQREEVRDRLSFLQLQAQVLFERVTFDLDEVQEAIRIIDKDVPRTDRDLTYYLGEGSGNLLVLRDILITYAAFHPEVSYAQGMNDLCSRFLEVLDSEVDTFWSFSCCMEKFSKDFRADGLHRKIELAAALLSELDPQLHDHLVTDGMESFTFCHRWLLLGFQREFEHGDALRLFEILSCDHLELISQQVDRARYRERLAQKHSTEDNPAPAARAVNTEFTFELFICATILIDNRDSLLRCYDDVQLIQFTSSLQGTLDLDSILRNAEKHFYNYCKRSAWDRMNGCCKPRENKEDFFYQLYSLFF
ncbi:hypothetical protein NHX12_001731 [Muraenolepis orangiensis]|uniref:Rab-GAP TBC domain-containing protein n=1 Tax=Muraenolepis orangiensis TaxID=630683 RepID=A0A9Q0E3K9_9TELE|nr:hypothetical protein NHX12_001731 [Muraenolepis orangiensis]